MPRTRTRRRIVGPLAGALGIAVLLLGGQGTMALWSDAKTIEGTTLTTGRVDLAVNGQDAVTGFSALTMTNILPGASQAADLTVANNGNVPTTYSVGLTGDDPSLTPALSKRVTTGTAAGGSCTGTALTGSPTLAPGEATQLCVEVGLPSGASSTVAGKSTSLGITVTGRTTGGHWPDPVRVNGTLVSTRAIAAPVVTCANDSEGAALTWPHVDGATGYIVSVAGVPTHVTGNAFTATAAGVATVRAEFGEPWVSGSSNAITVIKTGIVAACVTM